MGGAPTVGATVGVRACAVGVPVIMGVAATVASDVGPAVLVAVGEPGVPGVSAGVAVPIGPTVAVGTPLVGLGPPAVGCARSALVTRPEFVSPPQRTSAKIRRPATQILVKDRVRGCERISSSPGNSGLLVY